MKTNKNLVFVVAVALMGCGEELPIRDTEAPVAEYGDAVDVPAEVLRNSSDEGKSVLFGSETTVVFLNFDGVTIVRSNRSDSTTNKSFIGGGGAVPAFPGTVAQRGEVIARVQQYFADFNITFVATRPTSGNYTMMAVGGSPSSIRYGAPSGVVGVAPLDCGNRMPRDVGFAFAGTIYGMMKSRLVSSTAKTIAHELGHTFGLPHTGDGCDVMSYSSCRGGEKGFLDKTINMQSDGRGKCGFYSVNTHAELLKVLGAKTGSTPPTQPPTGPPTDTVAPAVSISSPAQGATLNTTKVVVKATAADDTAVARIELHVDGKLAASRSSGPYSGDLFSVELTQGAHSIRLKAFDAANNIGQATVNFTITTTTPPATPPATPPTTTPPTTTPPTAGSGIYGNTCKDAKDCKSGICAEDSDGSRFCTETCNPDAPACIAGAGCFAAGGGGHVCAPIDAGQGPAQPRLDGESLIGGCSLGDAGDAGAPPVSMLLLLLVATLIRRRR